MSWWVSLLLGVLVIATLLAAIFGKLADIINSLEQIIKSFRKLWNLMFKKRWIREGTYPIKLTINYTSAYGFNNPQMTPQILVKVLIEPRKPILLGRCEIEYFPSHFKGEPDKKWLYDDRAEDWDIGAELSKPRTYTLNFIFAPQPINGIQILVESEGYVCRSKPVTLTSEGRLGNDATS